MSWEFEVGILLDDVTNTTLIYLFSFVNFWLYFSLGLTDAVIVMDIDGNLIFFNLCMYVL